MRSIEANQLGTLHTLQAAAEAMQLQEPLDGSESRGKMVIISSIMGLPMLSKQAASYSMSKAAISHLGACLASQLIDERINVNTVNTVCPGWLDASEADIARLGAQMPWRRLGKPSEIGKAVVFLCSGSRVLSVLSRQVFWRFAQRARALAQLTGSAARRRQRRGVGINFWYPDTSRNANCRFFSHISFLRAPPCHAREQLTRHEMRGGCGASGDDWHSAPPPLAHRCRRGHTADSCSDGIALAACRAVHAGK
jgi:hypothetical protein